MNRDILLGKTPDGETVTVQIRLGAFPNPQAFRTVTHEPLPPEPLELAIAGNIYERGRDVGGGQCIDTAALVQPGPWSAEDLARLVEIWRRWANNGLNAGCAHMTLPEDTSYDARKDIRCPETGYKYGSAWLFDPLPDDVIEDVRRFQRRLGYPEFTYTGGRG